MINSMVDIAVQTAWAANLESLFFSLPNEILCIIGEMLAPRDLSALVRSTKLLGMVLNHILMRKILHEPSIGLWHEFNPIIGWAISRGHNEMAKKLLQFGRRSLDPMAYKEALERCAKVGDLDTFQAILDDSSHLLDLAEHGTEALNNAILSHSPEIYTLLANLGATAKAPAWAFDEMRSRTGAIHAAASWGRIDLLQFLLDHGASVLEEDNGLWQPLHFAAFHGQAHAVEFLLAHGADITATTGLFHTSLMVIAGRESRYLELSSNGGLKRRDPEITPGHLQSVEALLARGLYLNAKNRNGYSTLQMASANGYSTLVEHLVKLGADIDLRDDRERNSLHIAVANHHPAVVEVLLAAGASPASTNDKGATAIHMAAAADYPSSAFLTLLAAEGVDPHALDSKKWSAIHYAAHYGSMEILELLLRVTGSEFTLPSTQPITLHGAVAKGNLEMVRYLIDAGVEASAARKWSGESPLDTAVRYECEDIVRLLLAHGVGRHCGEHEQMLSIAAGTGSVPITLMLLRDGANANGVTAPSPQGQEPPLILAARNCNLAAVNMLLEEGADINILSNSYYSAIEKVACDSDNTREQRTAMISLLLDRGECTWGWPRVLSPLCQAGGYEDVIKKLMEAGPFVDKHHFSGYGSLLHDVVLRCSEEKPFSAHMFQYLLDKGADISSVNRELQTPLHLACAGVLDFDLQPLLASGLDPATRDAHGWTAFHYAAWAGHPSQTLQLLDALKQRATLKQGSTSGQDADPSMIKSTLNLKDRYGWTALHLAATIRKFDRDEKFYDRNFWESFHLLEDWGRTPTALPTPPHENYKVVELLLQSGADPSIVNDRGASPLDLARVWKEEIVYSTYPRAFLGKREANRKKSFKLLSDAHSNQQESKSEISLALLERLSLSN